MDPTQHRQRNQVLSLLQQHPDGLSTNGISKALAIRFGNLRPRLELWEASGLLTLREGVVGGSYAKVWSLTDAGAATLTDDDAPKAEAETDVAAPTPGQLTIDDEPEVAA